MDGGSSVFRDGERNHPDVGKTIELEDPYALIVNPPCLAHGAFASSRTSETKERASEQIKSLVDMCVLQHERNRTFLMEILVGEVTLGQGEFKSVQALPIHEVEGPRCRGASENKKDGGYQRWPSRWITNSGKLARAFDIESDRCKGKTWHRTVVQINGEPREVKGHPAA